MYTCAPSTLRQHAAIFPWLGLPSAIMYVFSKMEQSNCLLFRLCSFKYLAGTFFWSFCSTVALKMICQCSWTVLYSFLFVHQFHFWGGDFTDICRGKVLKKNLKICLSDKNKWKCHQKFKQFTMNWCNDTIRYEIFTRVHLCSAVKMWFLI